MWTTPAPPINKFLAMQSSPLYAVWLTRWMVRKARPTNSRWGTVISFEMSEVKNDWRRKKPRSCCGAWFCQKRHTTSSSVSSIVYTTVSFWRIVRAVSRPRTCEMWGERR